MKDYGVAVSQERIEQEVKVIQANHSYTQWYVNAVKYLQLQLKKHKDGKLSTADFFKQCNLLEKYPEFKEYFA